MSEQPKKSAVLAKHPLEFQWPTMDPFLFCAHHQDAFPAGNEHGGPNASLAGRNMGQDFAGVDGWNMYHGSKIPGFPGHPHRGFETVTVVRQGLVDHADSLGAAGRYGNGDVQWMTAGKGVQHSEMFPLVNKDKPNPLHLLQIWLNLPAASKMVDPYFTMFWDENVPRLGGEEAGVGEGVSIEVIAGACNKAQPQSPPPCSWAANPENHVWIWVITLKPGAFWQIPASEAGLNRMLYFFRGKDLTLDAEDYSVNTGLQLDSSKALPLVNGDTESQLLLLQGRPINEPVAHYGPFVMNTREELQTTFEEYQRTQFGGWPWPGNEPIHEQQGRFARYADGREEKPS